MRYKIIKTKVEEGTITTTVKFHFKGKEEIADIMHFQPKSLEDIEVGIINYANTISIKDDSIDTCEILADQIEKNINVNLVRGENNLWTKI